MVIFNTKERYGAVAIALHWIMALGLGSLVAMGLYMVGLPDTGFDKLKITLIHWILERRSRTSRSAHRRAAAG